MSKRGLHRTTSFLAIAIAFLFGGLLGWGLTKSNMEANQTASGLPTVGIGGGPEDLQQQQVISDTKLQLNTLLREHGNLAVLHLQAVYDGKDPVPSAQQLDANSQNLTNLITGLYGTQAGDMFLSMWKDHINQYINYTEGLKVNDQQKMLAAKQRLEQLAIDKGNMMHNLNNAVDAQEVTDRMNEHATLTLSIIDAYARGDQENFVTMIKQANDQASAFAAYLSERLSQQRLASPQ